MSVDVDETDQLVAELLDGLDEEEAEVLDGIDWNTGPYLVRS